MAGHVLAALDEQLGRVGSQANFDPLPMRLLDHLEHGALVEVPLCEDHLVGTDVLEDARQLLPGAETAEAGNPVLGNYADELVFEPASRCGKRGSQGDEALALTDEHDAAPDACGAHHLERDGRVRRSQQADGQGGREDCGRDEPGGREVVARPQPEREDDQRDDYERGEDATGSWPSLALAVEPRLGEHQDGDRRRELEPLRGPLAPEQPPEDVAFAAHQRTHDEREVDPESEPGDVEGDERENRERPPDEAQDRPAGEDVDTGGADVAPCGRRSRGRTRGLGRGNGLGHDRKLRAEPRRPTRSRAHSG